jgi:hypothetical protein
VLFIDQECLLVQPILAKSNLREVWTVVVIKSVDVVDDTCLVRLDGGQNQEVLEISVVAELRVVKHDFLEKLDELVGELCGNECLHCAAYLIGALTLW